MLYFCWPKNTNILSTPKPYYPLRNVYRETKALRKQWSSVPFNSIYKVITILLSLYGGKYNQLLHSYNHKIETKCMHGRSFLVGKAGISSKYWWVQLECLLKFLSEMYLKDKHLQSVQEKKNKKNFKILALLKLFIWGVFQPRPFNHSDFSRHNLLS